MKSHPSQSKTTPAPQDASQAPTEEWNASDPVWKLLGEASEPKEDVFFARNVVRAARQLEQERPTLGERLLGVFTAPRLALGAVACAGVLLAWQMIPSSTPQNSNSVVQDTTEVTPPVDKTAEETELSDLVMLETLSAAAEDPTIFTRDEVATMIGL